MRRNAEPAACDVVDIFVARLFQNALRDIAALARLAEQRERFVFCNLLQIVAQVIDGYLVFTLQWKRFGFARAAHIEHRIFGALFGKLRCFELVTSVRGPGGGYALARETATITVADIIAAVDEPLDETSCGGKENCKVEHRFMTYHS